MLPVNEQPAQQALQDGYLAAGAGDFEAAARRFRAAAALDSRAARPREALAQILLELGEPAAAADEAHAAVELAPGWTAALLTLGRASLNAGRFADAVLSLREALASSGRAAPEISGPCLDAEELDGVRDDLARAQALLLQARRRRVHPIAARPSRGPAARATPEQYLARLCCVCCCRRTSASWSSTARG